MASEAEWIAEAKSSIVDVLETEHAVVKHELIARLAERRFAGEGGNIDSHITGQSLDLLLHDGTVAITEAVTRGRRSVSTYSLTGAPARAVEDAAQRKRLLYARYLGWATGNKRHPLGIIGSAGEEAVRRAILAASTMTPAAAGAGEVSRILGTQLPGPTDSGGHIIGLDADRLPADIVTVLVEVKNIRDWMYPRHEKLFQVLNKAAVLQLAQPERKIMPVLVCRAAHKITFFMARHLGFLIIPMRAQYVGGEAEDGLAEVRNELHFQDLKLVTGPDPTVQRRFTHTLPEQALGVSERWRETIETGSISPLLARLSSDRLTDRQGTMNDLRDEVRALRDLDDLGW